MEHKNQISPALPAPHLSSRVARDSLASLCYNLAISILQLPDLANVILSYAKLTLGHLQEAVDKINANSAKLVAICSNPKQYLIAKSVDNYIPFYSFLGNSSDAPQIENPSYLLEKYFEYRAADLTSTICLSERFGRDGTGYLLSEHKSFNIFANAYTCFIKSNPDIVFFSKEPDNLFEYFLAAICDKYSVHTYFGRLGILSTRRCASKSWYTPLVNSDLTVHKDVLDISSFSPIQPSVDSETRVSDSILLAINNIRSNPVNFHAYQQLRTHPTLSILKVCSYLIGLLFRFKPLLTRKKIWMVFYQKYLHSYYCYLTRFFYWDKAFKYIYFPLHYQPELTTIPKGRFFANQLLTISLLSSILPDNYRILVKEHKATFTPGFNCSQNFRSREYYKYLSGLFNVTLAPLSLSTLEVLNCQTTKMIVTVSGTIAFEASCKNVPSIILGSSPWQNIPGSTSVSNVKELQDACMNIISNNCCIDENKLYEFLRLSESISLSTPPLSLDNLSNAQKSIVIQNGELLNSLIDCVFSK